MRLMCLRDFTWDKCFPGLDIGINTTLICLQLIEVYPNSILALISTIGVPASSSKPCCSMTSIIPSMPGDL
jgi:hypothetical protein